MVLVAARTLSKRQRQYVPVGIAPGGGLRTFIENPAPPPGHALAYGEKLQMVLGGSANPDPYYEIPVKIWAPGVGTIGQKTYNGQTSDAVAKDVVPSPKKGFFHCFDLCNVMNNDAAAQTVTIQKVRGATTIILCKQVVPAGETLLLQNGMWYVTFRGVPIPVSAGGTGLPTVPTGALLYGQGTSPLATLAIGSPAQIAMVNNAGNAPNWVTMSGDATIASSGALTIANNAISTAKILDANVTDAKLANMGARSVKGRSVNSSGVPADISFASAAGKFLGDRGSVLGAYYPDQRATRSGGGTVTAVAIDENMAIIEVDATAGNTTLPLAAVATAGAGYRVLVMKTDSSANTVTIDPNSSETINGALTNVLNAQYAFVELFCTGSAWLVLRATDEVNSGTPSNVSAGTSTQYKNIVTLSIPAGRWDIFGTLFCQINTGTLTGNFAGALSENDDNTTTDHVAGDNVTAVGNDRSDNGGICMRWPRTYTAATTVRLKGLAQYSGGSPQFAGKIRARRTG